MPASSRPSLADEIRPVRSSRSDLSRATICVAFATESFGSPVIAALNSTFPGRVRPAQIARERDADRRGQPAPVQCIALNDDDRSAESRPRSRRLRQLGPAHIALGDHHSVRASTCLPAAARKASSVPPTSANTRFIASVTSSSAWRTRYSSSAAAYTSLRGPPSLRGQSLGAFENVVWDRDGSFHTRSITLCLGGRSSGFRTGSGGGSRNVPGLGPGALPRRSAPDPYRRSLGACVKPESVRAGTRFAGPRKDNSASPRPSVVPTAHPACTDSSANGPCVRSTGYSGGMSRIGSTSSRGSTGSISRFAAPSPLSASPRISGNRRRSEPLGVYRPRIRHRDQVERGGRNYLVWHNGPPSG